MGAIYASVCFTINYLDVPEAMYFGISYSFLCLFGIFLYISLETTKLLSQVVSESPFDKSSSSINSSWDLLIYWLSQAI